MRKSKFHVSSPVRHGYQILGGKHPGAETVAREALKNARRHRFLDNLDTIVLDDDGDGYGGVEYIAKPNIEKALEAFSDMMPERLVINNHVYTHVSSCTCFRRISNDFP